MTEYDIDCDSKPELKVSDSGECITCDIDNDGVNELEINKDEIKCHAGLLIKALFTKLCCKK